MPLIMFNENDGRVSVNITLSRDIADDFTINIVGSMLYNLLQFVRYPSYIQRTCTSLSEILFLMVQAQWIIH